MLSIKIGLPQYKKSPPKAQNPRKVLDTHKISGNTYSGVKADYALINGRFFTQPSHITQALHFSG